MQPTAFCLEAQKEEASPSSSLGEGKPEGRAWPFGPVPTTQGLLPVVVSAGRRCAGRHGEAMPAADLPPEPPLPVEAAPGAGEEEAAGLVSLSPLGQTCPPAPAPAQASFHKGSPERTHARLGSTVLLGRDGVGGWNQRGCSGRRLKEKSGLGGESGQRALQVGMRYEGSCRWGPPCSVGWELAHHHSEGVDGKEDMRSF